MRPESGFQIAPNWLQIEKNGNDVIIFQYDVTVKYFDVAPFLLSSLVYGPSFMTISSLVQEL